MQKRARCNKNLMASWEDRPQRLCPDLAHPGGRWPLVGVADSSLASSQVKFLNKDNNGLLHSSIHSLPALVLDCEKDILDLDAQREHAHKVNSYFQYVRDTRKQRIISRSLTPACLRTANAVHTQ